MGINGDRPPGSTSGPDVAFAEIGGHYIDYGSHIRVDATTFLIVVGVDMASSFPSPTRAGVEPRLARPALGNRA